MKKTIKLNGALKWYFRWPLLLTVLLVCMNLCIYMIDHRAAGVMFVFVGIYFIIALLLYSFKRPAVMGEMVPGAGECLAGGLRQPPAERSKGSCGGVQTLFPE